MRKLHILRRKEQLRWLCLVLVAALAQPLNAQKLHRLGHRIDSILTARYQRADIDTNYVTRPQTKWTLTGRLNMSGATIKVEGTEEGKRYKSEVEADYKTTVSVGVSYLGVSLSLSLNPAKLMGKYRDYELNFRSYGRRFGFDIAYQSAQNFKGWYDMEGQQRIDLPEDVLSMKALNANAYYIFNHRRFSYPAAFGHSYIQRRSAGSFMLAASLQSQKTRTQDDMESVLTATNIALGAGYGYNFVPGRGWLLHLSALPTLIVYSKPSLTVDDIKIPLHYHFPEFIITSRGAVVRQIGRNMFAGISMVFNFTGIGNRDRLSIHNTKWLTRAYFGIRL